MHRVRLINKVIGPSNGIHPVCGKSGKLYGQAAYIPEHGGPVLDMSLEDYECDKFDIIGNRTSGQQWVPQFYECSIVVLGDGMFRGVTETVTSNPLLEQHQEQIAGMVHPGRKKLQHFNELRKRAKAACVWKPGMKIADVEKALSAVPD